MDNHLQVKYVEAFDSFLKSDVWEIIKYRLGKIYKDQVQYNVNHNTRLNNSHLAAINYGKLEGIDEVINITERIAGEIDKCQFDVDEALHVIENK